MIDRNNLRIIEGLRSQTDAASIYCVYSSGNHLIHAGGVSSTLWKIAVILNTQVNI